MYEMDGHLGCIFGCFLWDRNQRMRKASKASSLLMSIFFINLIGNKTERELVSLKKQNGIDKYLP